VNRKMAPEVHAELIGRWEPVYRSQLHYLVTWNTRGRRPVLRDRHARALHELTTEICLERGHQLMEFAVGSDHVHALLGLSPTQSVASAVREIKGATAMEMLSRHPELRVWLRGNLMWDERYSVETVSHARLEGVRERLRSIHSGDGELAEAG
jgi:REP-associated tyrosine transposase